MAAWFENDQLWERMESRLFDEMRFAVAPAEAFQVVRLLGITPGAEVLDLCCGPGRHSVELAQQGFRVTGVDRTARYLDRARRTAAERGVRVEFVEADMREFKRAGSFDGALNMYTSFGYFDDAGDDRLVLRNVRESMRPEGRLVMDLIGKEVAARDLQQRDWVEFPDRSLFLAERRIDDGWKTVRQRWINIQDGRRTEFEFVCRLYSATELAGLFESEGWKVEGLYGGLDGRPYDRDAERLVVVARV